MPIAASPASKIPGERWARGSLASEPVIPGGSGFARSGANGSASASFDFSGVVVGSCAGDGDGVCASVLAAKQEHNAREAISSLKAIALTRFIVSPLLVFRPAWFA